MTSDHNSSPVSEVDAAHWQAEVLDAKAPVLVAFLAPWSQACQVIQPVLEAVAASSSSGLKVLKVNADDSVDLGVWYDIQSVPTLLCFVNGQARVRTVGTASKEAILSKIEPFLTGARSEPSSCKPV